MKMTILPTNYIRDPLGRLSLLLTLLLMGCFAISPNVQAVNPPPDGGYPEGNTAEGQAALFSLTTGVANTAVGCTHPSKADRVCGTGIGD